MKSKENNEAEKSKGEEKSSTKASLSSSKPILPQSKAKAPSSNDTKKSSKTEIEEKEKSSEKRDRSTLGKKLQLKKTELNQEARPTSLFTKKKRKPSKEQRKTNKVSPPSSSSDKSASSDTATSKKAEEKRILPGSRSAKQAGKGKKRPRLGGLYRGRRGGDKSDNQKKGAFFYLKIVVIILLLCGIGYFVYLNSLETKVVVNIQSKELAINPEAYVVYNFKGKLDMLRVDYGNRKRPIQQQIEELRTNLDLAKGDYAGRMERKKILKDAIAQYEKEIPQIMETSKQSLDDLWKEEGAKLDKEYESFKENLHQEIEQRVDDLGIDYLRNKDLDALEVAVNAFRLALYNAPQGVDVDQERVWAEKLLERWHEFEKDWKKRQLAIKDKAMAIKKVPGPKIEKNKEKIKSLKSEVDALEIDSLSLKAEVDRYEADIRELEAKMSEIFPPFYKELLTTPKEYVLEEFTVDPVGGLQMRDLQEHPKLIPGEYTLLIRGRDNNSNEYWALKPFSVDKNKSTLVTIARDDFVEASSFLEKPL